MARADRSPRCVQATWRDQQVAVKVIKLPQRTPRTCPFLLSPSREMIPQGYISLLARMKQGNDNPSPPSIYQCSCQKPACRSINVPACQCFLSAMGLSGGPGIAGTDGNRTKKKDDALRGKVDDVVKVRTLNPHTRHPQSLFEWAPCNIPFRFRLFDFRLACSFSPLVTPNAAFKLKRRSLCFKRVAACFAFSTCVCICAA